MRRVLIILVIAVLSLSACGSPTTEQPATLTYTLSTSVSPSGSGSVSPSSGQYLEGSQVGLIATPATGYTFDYWSGDASGSSSAIIITMNSDKSITAYFVEETPAPTVTPAPDEAELKVHFIDVGQGDAILVDLGDTEILIDGGGKSPSVVLYLHDYVDGALEVMIATHPHADHIGGLIAVLEAFEVKEIWHNGESSTSQTYTQFVSTVQAEAGEVYIARRGDEITAGELTFAVLHPTTLAGSTNNNSIVLHLSYGDIDFLFTGDAEQEAETSMLDAGIVPNVEILKVGHHGSSSSSRTPFLNIARPEVAIYMAGEGNSYGHPHEETIIALAGIGAEIYGTDIHGTVLIVTDGKSYTIHLEKGAAPRTVPQESAATEEYSLNVSIIPLGSGSISPTGGDFVSGTELILTAIPNSGYYFVSWGGDASGSSPTVVITMDSNKNVVANFEELTTVSSNVQITRIFYDGLVYRTESDEYVEIANLGTEPQNLAGWVLRDIDEGYPSFTFPSYVLEPGASIRVYTNEIHAEWGGFSFGSGKAVWNNKSPDTAVLFNAQGQEVSRKSY